VHFSPVDKVSTCNINAENIVASAQSGERVGHSSCQVEPTHKAELSINITVELSTIYPHPHPDLSYTRFIQVKAGHAHSTYLVLANKLELRYLFLILPEAVSAVDRQTDGPLTGWKRDVVSLVQHDFLTPVGIGSSQRAVMVIRYTCGDVFVMEIRSFFVVYVICDNSEEVNKWTCLFVSEGKNLATPQPRTLTFFPNYRLPLNSTHKGGRVPLLHRYIIYIYICVCVCACGLSETVTHNFVI